MNFLFASSATTALLLSSPTTVTAASNGYDESAAQPHQADLDVILYGATGCVGHLAAEYLATQDSLTWAIADINATRLAGLQAELAAAGGASSKPEVIVARLDGSTNLTALVSRARAVATAAGPFSIHDGAALVQACAENGVHYADISDEFFWQREMVDSFHDAAVKSGARVVLGSGFCAVAGDLGSQLALGQLKQQGHQNGANYCVDAWLERYNGGISYGVEHTPHNASYPSSWNSDPYVLAPNAPTELRTDTLVDGTTYPIHPADSEGEIVSNIFGPYDARLLRRSYILRNQSVHLRVGALPSMYSEWIEFLAEHPFSWASLSSCPTKELLTKGSWRYRFAASSSESNGNDTNATVVLSGSGDPGYHFTSATLAEAALCLAGRTPGCTRTSSASGVLSVGAAFDELTFSKHLQAVGLLQVE